MEEQYSDEIIKRVAESQFISKAEAETLIEKCLRSIALDLKMSYADMYQRFTQPEFMGQCLVQYNCDAQTLEACNELCGCVVYEGKCRSRLIENVDVINRNPDEHIKTLSLKELDDLVKLASYLYYNYEGGGLDDNAFDALEYFLKKRLNYKQRRYEKIGAPPIEKLRAQLPFPMASLQKVKPATKELRSFLSSDSSPLVWSHKIDGVSGLIVYQSGIPVEAYTRGDGIIGGNVSYLIDYLDLPEISHSSYQSIVVRGEFMVSKKNFHDKYHARYSFPRSFVVSKINSGFISLGVSDVEFLAYHIVDVHGSKPLTPQETFDTLELLNFKTPVHGLFKNRLEIPIMLTYTTEREKAAYTIDGLVLTNNARPSVFGQFTSVAFKMMMEDQIRSTKVIDVDWDISRHGKYVPVAVYDAVYVDGARLHRASAHNAQHVMDWSMGRGTKITVARSGDIIPQIKDVVVDTSIEPIFPPLEPSWHWEGKLIMVDDIEGNKRVNVKRSSYFFQILGVPRLREGVLEKMYDAGYKTLHDVVGLSEKKFQTIKGIGKKTAHDFYTNIHTTMQNTRIDRYAVSLSTLESGIGRALIKSVLKVHPDIFKYDEATIENKLKTKKVPKFGPARIAQFSKNAPIFMKYLRDLNEEDITMALEKEEERLASLKTLNPKLNGKSFVMSGFMDHPNYALEDLIEDHGGDLSSVVTSSTTAVITAYAQITTKILNANELGIPIYTVDEFYKTYLGMITHDDEDENPQDE